MQGLAVSLGQAFPTHLINLLAHVRGLQKNACYEKIIHGLRFFFHQNALSFYFLELQNLFIYVRDREGKTETDLSYAGLSPSVHNEWVGQAKARSWEFNTGLQELNELTHCCCCLA